MQLIYFFLFSFMLSGEPPTPVYELVSASASGDSIRFNNFRGKKILIVNIASGSSRINQLSELKQLQAQYPDDLRVVVFPSNSFGNEPLEDSAIAKLCIEQYQISFPVAAKSTVKGNWRQGIYSWLGSSELNGQASLEPKGDFTKYLISKNGQVCGVYSPELSPVSSIITNAIANPNN